MQPLRIALAILVFPFVSQANWAEKLSVKGDLRLRHQTTNEEQTAGADDVENNEEDRLRLRVKIKGQVSENMQAKLRLASGSGGATSTNQTLSDGDGGFRAMDIFIDRAWLHYAPEAQGDFHHEVRAGKMANPMYFPGRSQLIFDGDVNPEGLHLRLDYKPKSFKIMTNFAHFKVVSRDPGNTSPDGPDANLGAAQLALGFALGDNVDLVLGGTSYKFSHIKDFGSIGSSTSFKGNSNTGGVYDFEYELTESFAELTWWIKDRSCPITLYYDAVTNGDPTANNKAHLYGLSLGKTKEKGDWQAGVNFRKVEADATLGALADGDAFGGGTDGEATVAFIAYNVTGAAIVNIGHFSGIQDIDNEKDFERTQVDFVLKF